MRKVLMTGVSGLALTALAGGAGLIGLTAFASSAEAGSAYLALGAGFASGGSRDWDRAPPPSAAKFSSGEIDIAFGPAFEGAIGFDLGSVWSKEGSRLSSVGLRVELQATYLDLDVDDVTFGSSISAPPGDRGGHLTETLLMANLLVDFDVGVPDFTPYVGLGIGVAMGEMDAGLNLGGSGPSFLHFDETSDTDFVWQILVGASVHVAPNLDVYGNYRLIGLPDFRVDDESDKGGPVDFEDEFSHTFTVGIRYNFM